MADLDHLAEEFELVHAAVPGLLMRLAKVEKWVEIHPDIHSAERRAVDVAHTALEKKMVEFNDVRNRFIDKEEYRREHQRMQNDIQELSNSRIVNSSEKSLLEKLWPLFLAAL